MNLYEAKTDLSRLVDRAAAGEEIVIGKNGKPLARLVPFKPVKRSDAFGMDRGLITIAADFDATPDDFAEYL